jgi:hypothetical protein
MIRNLWMQIRGGGNPGELLSSKGEIKCAGNINEVSELPNKDQENKSNAENTDILENNHKDLASVDGSQENNSDVFLFSANDVKCIGDIIETQKLPYKPHKNKSNDKTSDVIEISNPGNSDLVDTGQEENPYEFISSENKIMDTGDINEALESSKNIQESKSNIVNDNIKKQTTFKS